ncbi:beta-hexosaminidase [Hyaloscypha sp. PMI_1271]|nr:beta-hexosaminidase [Hyaloscypha sp. PMI_1271]
MRISFVITAVSLSFLLGTSTRWLGIPTVPFVESDPKGTFSLKQLKYIIVDTKYQNTVDTEGETLITPSLRSFASTFSDDLSSSLDLKAALPNSIFMTIGNSSHYLDAAGRPTSEGYSINITKDGIVITGASPLGAFWRTRSILQQGVLSNGMQLSLGNAIAPGWGVRGTFLDVGRHYYPPEFLIEMCSYLSFFKQNTFHLHLSDSPGLNPDLTYEEKLDFYSAFRLNSPDPAVEGLIKPVNESYSQFDFENIQQSCFHSKTVHLGADEYSSSEIADYNLYVNTMHAYLGQNFDKKVLIWGTFQPSKIANETNINHNISIQHWEYFEANPYFDFMKNGYHVLNTNDQFYIVAKCLIFHGAPDGGPTAPYIFDKSNASNNPPRDSPYVLGQMPALWNDFGPNSTSVMEAYYALREGLPALRDKQWGGDLLMHEYFSIFETLHAAIPGQNLDWRIDSKTNKILSYDFSSTGKVYDKSGNGYDSIIKGDCSVADSVLTIRMGCSVTTPLTSKGRNYTLAFSVRPTSSVPGTLFSGSASSLLTGNGSISNVMLVTGGSAYVLNYTLPLHVWTHINLIGIGNATYLSVTPSTTSEETVHEFTATIGDYSNSFIWNNPMAIEAPVAVIGGDNFQGEMKKVTLVDGADEKYVGFVKELDIGVAPYE